MSRRAKTPPCPRWFLRPLRLPEGPSRDEARQQGAPLCCFQCPAAPVACSASCCPSLLLRSGRAPEYLRLNGKVVDLVKYFVE